MPFLAFIVLRTPIYGQIRQVLFALPPIFLLSAVGLDDIWKRSSWNVLGRVAILALALLPSVIGIAALYPYEYVYFNGLAGGAVEPTACMNSITGALPIAKRWTM